MYNIVKLLALALTNVVLDLANLAKSIQGQPSVTNLTKPSLDLEKIWARLNTIINQN